MDSGVESASVDSIQIALIKAKLFGRIPESTIGSWTVDAIRGLSVDLRSEILLL